MAEEPKAPESQDKPEELEQRLFNQDAREAIEDSYAKFAAGEKEKVAETIVPAQDPEEVPEKSAEKIMETAPSESVPVPAETWTPEFKDQMEAEKSYKNARIKMQEATERSVRLEREVEELRKLSGEMFANMQAKMAAPPAPQPTAPQALQFSREELEAKFFEDPVGFVFSLQEAAKRAAIEEVTTKTQAERNMERKRMAVQTFTNQTQKYFDDTYADLKPIEPLVTDEIQRVWSDPTFMRPINDDKKLDVISKAKAVVDEASKRVRTRLPDLGKALGLAPTGEPTKERLTSGAPPVVPGGGSGPGVRPSPPPAGETFDEYISNRMKQQDRMRASNWGR